MRKDVICAEVASHGSMQDAKLGTYKTLDPKRHRAKMGVPTIW